MGNKKMIGNSRESHKWRLCEYSPTEVGPQKRVLQRLVHDRETHNCLYDVYGIVTIKNKTKSRGFPINSSDASFQLPQALVVGT